MSKLEKMILLKQNLSYTKAFNIALLGSFYMLSLAASSVLAKEAKKSQEKLIVSQNICPKANLLPIRSFETQKYRVYICKGDRRHRLGYYVRIPKSGGKFAIPVTAKRGETYIAKREEAKYSVNPYEMLAIKANRVVLQEEVKYAVSADGKPLKKGCPQGQNTFVKAETKSFITYICGDSIPSSYIAILKSGIVINLPLKSYKYSEKSHISNSKYLANQGNISYILTRKALRVSQSGRIRIKEKILQWKDNK